MNSPTNAQNDTTNETEKPLSRSVCCGIYGLKNKITGKWYVGQTTQPFRDRWLTYKRMKCKSQPKIYNALIKYGYDTFDKIVLELCSNDPKILCEREKYWITQHDSVNNGYNVIGDPTQSPMSGRFHSEETKSKMASSKMNKAFSDEHRKAISAGWILRKIHNPQGLSNEAREIISAAHKGKSLSEEHKSKLRKPKSEEHRQKIAAANKIRNAQSKGKKQSPDHIKKRVEAWKSSRAAKASLPQQTPSNYV